MFFPLKQNIYMFFLKGIDCLQLHIEYFETTILLGKYHRLDEKKNLTF